MIKTVVVKEGQRKSNLLNIEKRRAIDKTKQLKELARNIKSPPSNQSTCTLEPRSLTRIEVQFASQVQVRVRWSGLVPRMEAGSSRWRVCPCCLEAGGSRLPSEVNWTLYLWPTWIQ